METKQLVGKRVEDKDDRYKGDTGKVSDTRHFEKANKTYAVVEWDENSKHGKCYRNYDKSKVGTFKRFKLI